MRHEVSEVMGFLAVVGDLRELAQTCGGTCVDSPMMFTFRPGYRSVVVVETAQALKEATGVHPNHILHQIYHLRGYIDF